MGLLSKSSILISIALINIVYSLPTEKNNETRKENQEIRDISNKTKVEELEKQKSDLFNEINLAIDDSVKLMTGSNDTEMLSGIQQLEILKEHVRDLNEHKIEVKRRHGGKIRSSVTSGKSNKGNNDEKGNPREGSDDTNLLRKNYDFVKLDDLMKKSIKKKEKDKQREINIIKVQQKLDEWVAHKDFEKIKNKEEEIRLKRISNEKCPRFGKLGVRNPKTYPCCRKCCKQSYVGCL